MDLSVCVPVHLPHGEPNLATLAGALPAACGDLAFELVVALNGLSAEAARVPDGARTVRLEHNMGVGPGYNAAATEAAADVLVFCADDVVLGPGSLARLHEALGTYPEAGAVGPFGQLWDRRAWNATEPLKPFGDEVIRCDAIPGHLLAVRRADYDAVGGFDEEYAPTGWEDLDFNLALQAQGKASLAVGGAPALRSDAISPAVVPPWTKLAWGGRRESLRAIHARNRARFLQKWT